jgi:hypothetical protein
MITTKLMAINRIRALLDSKQDNYIIIIKTSDLIQAGYYHLTSGDSMYTCVNRSWL